MSEERIQKILARAGIAARRKAEELIREGRVTVNGKVAELGQKADPSADAIKVDGKRVQPGHAHRYLLLNKPKGYLTAVSDPQGRPTVLDLVPPALRRALVPVGRLDFHTEGLLLLTDDGELANRVSHPRFGCHKTYEVKVKGIPEESGLERLRRGIVLDGRRTSPARIEPLRRTRRGEETGNSWFRIELSEGRTRQIREMFFRIGHPVQKLRRVAIGPLADPHLPVGGLRELEEAEVRALERATREATAKPGPPAGGARRGAGRR
ncbi:MAG TPA: pseudouridine synthase [Thermoanaerobaculia bacterium]|nr:pseudouridine synthase [Thermoanaerobaculia bacterium]